jgi:hypothetical protein
MHITQHKSDAKKIECKAKQQQEKEDDSMNPT